MTTILKLRWIKLKNFFEKENKVKITLVLFGRERMHANLGVSTLDEIAEKFADMVDVEKKYADKQKAFDIDTKKSKIEYM